MFKSLFFFLLAGTLVGETIGNLEFDFPPSKYEWKLLLDSNTFDFSDDDDDDDDDFSSSDYQWGQPVDASGEDLDAESPSLKVFTHREGDALEIFVALIDTDPEADDDDEEEPDTLEEIQAQIDEALNEHFPNHRMILISATETDDGGSAEWELSDGTNNLMHGYTRYFEIKKGGDLEALAFLSYLTTAEHSEYNRSLWTNVLNQAHVLD